MAERPDEEAQEKSSASTYPPGKINEAESCCEKENRALVQGFPSRDLAPCSTTTLTGSQPSNPTCHHPDCCSPNSTEETKKPESHPGGIFRRTSLSLLPSGSKSA
jgi:hypothetical protein